ncbi:mitochondrial carrier domain-containing protein [Lipomyces japonicus]|uniref:mitochondrial carrier domain-containing protein n=1 Tax=Lipomyces japonicus TaxID=56871 RepID=UPI0034CF1A53
MPSNATNITADLSIVPNSLSLSSSSSSSSSLSSQVDSQPPGKHKNKKKKYVSATTAGTRAVIAQFISFYARVPIKLFRPTRVDYMLVPRAINPAAGMPWKFNTHSSIALLSHAVKSHGWTFLSDQVLPPLLANSAIGIVLYATYLTSLSLFAERQPSADASSSTTFGTLTWKQTWLSGFVAGSAQSLAAAPIDAIFTRFSVAELLIPQSVKTNNPTIISPGAKHKSLWIYGKEKLRAIGFRGVFAGYGLSFIKESLGFAFFFSTFEIVKQASYDRLILQHGTPLPKYVDPNRRGSGGPDPQHCKIRDQPSAALYPAMILTAGAAATMAIQAVQYPLQRLQNLHLTILESIDFNTMYNHNKQMLATEPGNSSTRSLPYSRVSNRQLLKTYVHAYREMFRQAKTMKNIGKRKTWFAWMYKGWLRNTLSALPSSSIGLFVFEIMRIRFEEVESLEGSEILVA